MSAAQRARDPWLDQRLLAEYRDALIRRYCWHWIAVAGQRQDRARPDETLCDVADDARLWPGRDYRAAAKGG